MSTEITPASVREDFGGQHLTPITETSASAAAAQASAQVQARYIVAMKRPRDWMVVRHRLLDECKRSGFARSALYRKPVGGQSIVGFSIRFAEAALRCMTNMMPETVTIYDDNRKRILCVRVTDLEANLTYAADITIEKTVERKRLGNGQKALSSRANSHGDIVYLVEATEGDLMNKEGSAISKCLRNLALRMLPGDIQDDCRAALDATLLMEAGADPAAKRKALADAFSSINVPPHELTRYLGHTLETLSPAEVVDLRQVFEALKSKETSWQEVVTARLGDGENEERVKPSAKTMAAKDKIKAAAQKGRDKGRAGEPEKSKRPEPLPELPPVVTDEQMKDLGYDTDTGEVGDE